MNFRNSMVRLFMMNKRLYKKPAFVTALLLIIVMTVIILFSSNDGGRVVSITLCAENSNDTVATDIIKELTSEKSVVKFSTASSKEQAYSNVENGISDACWIFADNTEKGMKEYVEDGSFKKPFVQIYQQEDSAFLMLAREKLYAKLYPYLAYDLYSDFMSNNYSEDNEQLKERYYNASDIKDDIMDISFLNSDTKVEETNFLVTPLRGVLAMFVMLTSLASVMYFMNDKKRGALAWINPNRHIFVEGEYIAVSAINTAVFALVALGISGVFTSFGKELLLMLLYVIMSIGFSILIGEICGRVQVIGSVLPGLMLIMLAVCPVFVVLPGNALQYVFPPFYYLNALYDSRYILYMLIYIGAVCASGFVINRIKTGNR